MRIIAGAFRGRRLASVGRGDAAAQLRPTSDRVRESLFNVLTHRDAIDGARVLDLFAGTGALGLEALSRGADEVVFVESGRVAQGLIRENIRLTGSGENARLVTQDATRLGPCPGGAATLVFLDPPYGRDLGAKALAVARDGGWIAPGALIVWEEAEAMEPPEGFAREDSRAYGGTQITLLRFTGSGEAC